MKLRLAMVAPLLALLMLGCSSKEEGFTVDGTVKGVTDKTVYLIDTYNQDFSSPLGGVIIDSTTVVKDKFTFKGQVDHPKLVTLYIDMGGNLSYKELYSTMFYLDNSKIKLEGTLDNFFSINSGEKRPEPPVITGSATQDKYLEYRKSKEVYDNAYTDAITKYYNQAVDPGSGQVKDVEQGITLYQDVLKAEADLRAFNMDFIRNNADNIIGLNVAKDVLINNGGIEFTAEEVEEIHNLLDKNWKGVEAYDSYETYLKEIKNIAIGQPIMDFKAVTLDGKEVSLKESIAPERYTLIDFWASWCGPCRHENPHLLEVHKQYGDRINIISISVDEDEEAWKKAVEEDQLTWTQIRLPEGPQSEGAKLYNIQGIPFCIFVSPEGKILASDARGSKLDILLQEYVK